MNKMGRSIIFLIVVFAGVVNAFSKGGPRFMCKNLTPGHSNGTQSSPPPYSLSVISNIMRPGGTTSVILESTGDYPFKGFLCAVSELTDTSNNPVGRMSLSSSTNSSPDIIQTLNCSRASESTGITQKNSNEKYRVDFDWTAPTNAFMGQQYKLRCTCVLSFYQCWTDIRVDLTIGIPTSPSDTTSTLGNNGDSTFNLPSNTNGPNGNGNQGNNNGGFVVSDLNDQNSGNDMGNNSPVVQRNGGNLGGDFPSLPSGVVDTIPGPNTDPVITPIPNSSLSPPFSNQPSNSNFGRGNTAVDPIIDSSPGNEPAIIDPLQTNPNNPMSNFRPVDPNQGNPSLNLPLNPLLTRPSPRRNGGASVRSNTNRNRDNVNNRNSNSNLNARARNPGQNRNNPSTNVDPFFDTSFLRNNPNNPNLVNRNIVRQNEMFLDSNFVQEPAFNFPRGFFFTQDAIQRFNQRNAIAPSNQRNAIAPSNQRLTQQTLDMFQEFRKK